MAVHGFTQEIRSTVYGWYNRMMGRKPQRSPYLKYVFIGSGIVLVSGILFFMYRWYVSYRERAAQRVFAQYVTEYRRAYQQGTGWGAVQDLFQLGADQQSGSYLHPYFLAFQADALLKEGKKDEALAVLDKVVASLRSNDPVAPLFKMKHALLQIDMPDAAVQQVGLQSLINLAHDETNKFRDAAQFFLGDYYWAQDNMSEAQNVWSALVQSQHDIDMVAVSPWARQAQQKLAQIA